jgi:pimeloyl-ACP methyl ester carboxylesterase
LRRRVPAPTTTRATTPDGLSLAVYDWGGSGAPVLLCHPTGFHGRVWAPIAARLIAAGRRVHSFDFRGHGDSDAPPPTPPAYDWRRFADDALAVADHLDVARDPQLSAAGHSAGGTSLLIGEARRPGTYARIWTYEPIIFPDGAQRATDAQMRLASGARKRRDEWSSVDEAYAVFASKPPLNALDPATLRAYVDHALRDRGDGVLELVCRPDVEAQIYAMGPDNGAWSILGDVPAPVAVASGAATNAMLPALVGEVVSRLPHARHELWDGRGHFGPLEDPDRGAASILAGASRATAT